MASPRYTKAHSKQIVDRLVALGLVVVHEFTAEPPYDSEPYEYLLEWRGVGEPRTAPADEQ